MKCSQLVRIHLIFFQLLGFCPLRVCDFLKKDTLQESVVQKISVGWSYLLVAVLIVQTWIAYRYEHVIFFTVDFFGKFNDLVKFIAISIACYTIQLDSIYRRHQSTIFWENCYELQCTQKSILKDGSKILNIKDFFVKFYGFAVIFFVVEYNVAPVFQHNDSMCNFRLIYLPTLFMARFYFIYYLMYIEIVKTNVKTLNQELELLVTLSNMSINSNNSHHLNNFIAKRLNGAKTFYALLYQMTEWINESFGWAILATFLSSFVELFSNSYWIYWRVYNRFTQYFIGIDSSLNLQIFKKIIFYQNIVLQWGRRS